MNEFCVYHLSDELRSQPLNFHRSLRCEMFNSSFYLGRAGDVLTPYYNFAFRSDDSITTNGTFIWKNKRFCLRWAFAKNHLYHFWNDIPSTLDENCVSNANILPIDFILIVQSSAAYDSSSDIHRFQVSHRCDGTCTTHRSFNVFQNSGCLLSFKFPGNCPSRRSGANPKLLPFGKIVDLNNNAINVVRKFVSFFLPRFIVINGLFNTFTKVDMRIHRESPLF